MAAALGGRLLDAHGDDRRRGGAALGATSTALDLGGLQPDRPASASSSPATSTTRCSASAAPRPCTARRRAPTPERGGAARRRAGALGRRWSRRRTGRGRPATTGRRRRRRGRVRRARRARRASCRPGDRAAARARGFAAALARRRTWSSPGRARSTSRPCTARRPPAWPRRPRARACRWSRCADARPSMPTQLRGAGIRRRVRADRHRARPAAVLRRARARCWSGSASGSRASDLTTDSARRSDAMSEYDLVVAGRGGPCCPAASAGRRRGHGRADRRGRAVRRGELAARRASSWPTTRCCCPGSSTPTCTSTSPGRTEWEGFATATRAAAAGGVTTIVDMPLNSIPPTVDVAALEVKRKAADGAGVRGRRVLGRRGPRQPRPTCGRCTTSGVFGFKCFLLRLGRRRVPAADAGRARRGDARDRRVRRAAHRPRRGRRRRSTHAAAPPAARTPSFLASRPRAGREPRHRRRSSTGRAATGCRIHILHLSSADALPHDRAPARGRRASASPPRPARTT